MPSPKTTVGKALKTSVWVAISAAVAALITALVPALETTDLAWLAPIVNVLLVTVKNYLDKNVANI